MNRNLSIAAALRRLFPSATPGVDYTLQDDGDGPYIKSWLIEAPEPTAEQLLAAGQVADCENTWCRIKEERDRRKGLGFQCAGHWYHSDGESKTQHLGNKDTARDQIAAGGQPADPLRDPITNQPIVWKTMSGQFVPLTCALAIDIVAAGKSAEFATYAAAETHRAAMEVSADPEAYDFSSGWPAVYEG